MKKLVTYCFLSILVLTCSKRLSFAQVDIIAMEYFIDNGDLGVGANTPIPITAGASILESFSVPTNTLSVGFHTLYIRVQDFGGEWSLQESRSFYVNPSNLTVQANVSTVEYFIDTDPGYGNGTSLGSFSTTDVTIDVTIPTSSLSAGFHILYIRAQDSDGIWGNLEYRSFYVNQSGLTTQANVVDIEYFIDTDPGYGNGTSLGSFSSTDLTINATILTSSLSAGNHILYTRAQDSDGVWSESEPRTFYVDAYASGLLTGVEYFFDTDPGIGSGTVVPIAPPVASIDEVVNLSTATVTAGIHEVGIRIMNENGSLGMTEYFSVNICDVAIANFVTDVVCVGTATTFTETSTGIVAGDIYSWDFDGDATEDSNTNGNQSFSFATAGTFNATLTIDRAGCINTVVVPVQVEPAATADAGVDQDICIASTTLAANPPGANETGNWQLVAGTAIITTPGDPQSTITGITTESVELSWTVTNSLGNCSDIDNVIINANLPITTSAVVATVDIGQSVIIDVLAGVTSNSGDILTPTITDPPTNGTLEILGDNTLNYTPNDDATNRDSFVFRITNQCNNFSESDAQITIINQPPVIDNGSFTPPTGNEPLEFDLTTLISDPNNNLDFSSLRIVTQPISGALASIDANSVLIIDYTGVTFSGNDELEIEICDLVGVCTVQRIVIPNVNVGGENPPIKVFNAVSPNGDGYHDFLEIENIEFYPDNTVIILNRWGNEVGKYKGYNNQDVVFNTSTLPAGTYYYHVLSGVDAVDPLTGFFLLKYDN